MPSVSPGNAIPRVWGTMKVPAQMVFSSPLIETMHTHQQSKKGGGKGSLFGHTAKTYTFTYSVDAAWAICGGPLYQINRIWANQKLLWVNPVLAGTAQQTFDDAYQAEATRLIDQQGVQLDYAAASAFVFAFNNYDTSEVTLSSPSDAVNYIESHPIVSTTLGTVTPDVGGVTAVIDQMYSGLNNGNQYQSTINRFDSMELYLGTETQGPNGLLEGYLGQGNATSYRACAYLVITNLQLMDFGNTVPSLTVEVQQSADGNTSLPAILTSICYQAGLTTGQFDCISNVDSTAFKGFAVTANTSARDIISDLQKVFGIDSAETGFGIVFSMINKPATQIISRYDLGAHQDTDVLPPSQEVTIADDYDLPQRINLKFQEPARNFSINMLYAARYNTPNLAIEDLDITVGLDRSTAQKCVNNLLGYRMLAKRTYKMMLPRQYVGLEPTDAFKIANKYEPNRYDQYYCTEVHVGANGVLEVHAADHYYVDPALTPHDQATGDLNVDVGGNLSLPTTSATSGYLLDVPLLLDTDKDGTGFYVVLAGTSNGWQGGQLYVDAAAPSVASAYGLSVTTPTSGSAWTALASSSINVPHGVCMTALASGMDACYWDRVSSITVQIFNGMELVSASEDDMLVQSLNVAAIGNDTYGYEIVQYSTAVAKGTNGLYVLSGFLRGQRGTERLMDGHVKSYGATPPVADKFIRLTSALSRVLTTTADLNQIDHFYTASNSGKNDPTNDPFSFTDTGNSLKPYTVYVYQKTRIKGSAVPLSSVVTATANSTVGVSGAPTTLAANDIVVSWWPRVRQNGQFLSGADVALAANDSPETYSVDVCTAAHPATAVKTYTLTGAQVALGTTFVYTAAMQASDGLTPGNPVYLAIYQVSSTIIGRGNGIGVIV